MLVNRLGAGMNKVNWSLTAEERRFNQPPERRVSSLDRASDLQESRGE